MIKANILSLVSMQTFSIVPPKIAIKTKIEPIFYEQTKLQKNILILQKGMNHGRNRTSHDCMKIVAGLYLSFGLIPSDCLIVCTPLTML